VPAVPGEQDHAAPSDQNYQVKALINLGYVALLRRAHAGRSRRVGVDEFLGACCVGDGGSAPPASPCGGRRQTTSSCIGWRPLWWASRKRQREAVRCGDREDEREW